MVGLTVSLEMAALGAEERRMCFFFSFFVFKSSKHIFQEAAQWLAVGNVSLLASSKVMLAGAVSDGRGALKKLRTHTNKAHIHPE